MRSSSGLSAVLREWAGSYEEGSFDTEAGLMVEAADQLDGMLDALRLHKAWADSEDAGPDYGGQTRDTHPDGERIWRIWWDNQLDLCDRAQKATDAAIAKRRAVPMREPPCINLDERLAALVNALWLAGVSFEELERRLSHVKSLGTEERTRARIVLLANEMDMRFVAKNLIDQGSQWDRRAA